MNKRVNQYNLKHGDKPTKTVTFSPPPPMLATLKSSKSSKDSLITKESELEESNVETSEDIGNVELENMMACVEDSDEDFTCAGSAELIERNNNEGINDTVDSMQDIDESFLCQFLDDNVFASAPGIKQES